MLNFSRRPDHVFGSRTRMNCKRAVAFSQHSHRGVPTGQCPWTRRAERSTLRETPPTESATGRSGRWGKGRPPIRSSIALTLAEWPLPGIQGHARTPDIVLERQGSATPDRESNQRRHPRVTPNGATAVAIATPSTAEKQSSALSRGPCAALQKQRTWPWPRASGEDQGGLWCCGNCPGVDKTGPENARHGAAGDDDDSGSQPPGLVR